MDKKLDGFSAPKLRLVLASTIVVIGLISAGGFYYVRDWMTAFAKKVEQANAQAAVSNNDISRLQKLQADFQNDQVAITRASMIVADSDSYQYQDQIINDITNYGKEAGIDIRGFSFTSDSAGGASSSGSAAPAASGSTDPTAAAIAAEGLKIVTVSVSMGGAVPYKSIMHFIHLLENNLTKMQITNLTMSKDTASNKVIVNPIDIQIYTKPETKAVSTESTTGAMQ